MSRVKIDPLSSGRDEVGHATIGSNPQGLVQLDGGRWLLVTQSRLMIGELNRGSADIERQVSLGSVAAGLGVPSLNHFSSPSRDRTGLYWVPIEAQEDDRRRPGALIAVDDQLRVRHHLTIPERVATVYKKGRKHRIVAATGELARRAAQQVLPGSRLLHEVGDFSLPWCAIDPDNAGVLYLGSSNHSPSLVAYDLSALKEVNPRLIRRPGADVILTDVVSSLQGPQFAAPFDTIALPWYKHHKPVKILGVTVRPDRWTNFVRLVDRAGDTLAERKYNFPFGNDEIEGAALDGNGNLVVSVADNDFDKLGLGNDEFYVYAIRVRSNVQPHPGPGEAAVPPVAPGPVGAAIPAIENAGLVASVTGPGNLVTAQSPSSGTIVKLGSTVVLTVKEGIVQ